MSTNENLFEETVAVATQLVSTVFGSPVVLAGSPDDLGGGSRSRLFRLRVLDAPPHAPSSVIAKRVFAQGNQSHDATMPEQPSPWFLNEWAGLRFLEQASGNVPLAPKLYAADRQAGILILEDMGEGLHLEQVLLGNDPVTAEKALFDLAMTLGRMHVLTRGKEAELDRMRDSLATKEVENLTSSTSEAIMRGLRQAADALDFSLTGGVENELKIVTAFLTQPGPFNAYIHGDACPDNCLYAASTMKLIDFEGGRYGHALIDGVFADLYFPSCLCVNRIPEDIVSRTRLTYRHELVKGFPEAADDTLFSRARVEACMFWILLFCDWLPISRLLASDYVKDRRDRSTGRQRVLVRFERVVRMTKEVGHLEALGSLVGRMAEKLRTVWPNEADAMPFYPAFR